MKSYIKIFLLMIAVFLSNLAFAQSSYTNNLYTSNMFGINPAYSGTEGGTYFGIQARNSLTGLAGAPKTGMLVLHGSVGKNVGMGVQIISDQIGAFRNTGVLIAPSYTAVLSENTNLSFGLAFGFMTRSIDLDYVDINGYVDPTDQTLTSNIFNGTNFTGQFGVKFTHKNLEISASLPQLLDDKKELNEHFRGLASYKFFPGVGKIKIQPSVMYQVLPLSKNQVDGNLMFEFNKLIWIQGTYRSNENIIVSSGVKVEKIDISYAFELQNGKQSDAASNSHEIFVAFRMGTTKERKTVSLSDKLLQKRERMAKEAAAKDSLANAHIDRLDGSIEKMDKVLSKNKDNSKRLKALEKELKKMKKDLGDVTVKIKNDSEKISTDKKLVSLKDSNGKSQPIEKGNYVVIQTCTKQKYAEKLVTLYKAKGVTSGVAYNPKKGYYYVYESFHSAEFDTAIDQMKSMRKKGFTDAWVLIYGE